MKGVDSSLAKFGFGKGIPFDYFRCGILTLKLDADYIDLFLIHDPLSGPVKRIETYKALLEAKDKGKIRSVGVSN